MITSGTHIVVVKPILYHQHESGVDLHIPVGTEGVVVSTDGAYIIADFEEWGRVMFPNTGAVKAVDESSTAGGRHD